MLINNVSLILKLQLALFGIFIAKELNAGKIVATCIVACEVLLTVGYIYTVYVVVKVIVVEVFGIGVAKVSKTCIVLINMTVTISDNKIRLDGSACRLIAGNVHSVPLSALPYVYVGNFAVLETDAFVKNELTVARAVTDEIVHKFGNFGICGVGLLVVFNEPVNKEYDCNNKGYNKGYNACCGGKSTKD